MLFVLVFYVVFFVLFVFVLCFLFYLSSSCVFCFICLRLVSFVPDVASFYGLFILDCPFGFLFLVFLFAFPLKKSIIQSVSDDDRIIFFIDVLMIGATKPWLSSFCIKSRFLRFYCYVHYVCG